MSDEQDKLQATKVIRGMLLLTGSVIDGVAKVAGMFGKHLDKEIKDAETPNLYLAVKGINATCSGLYGVGKSLGKFILNKFDHDTR